MPPPQGFLAVCMLLAGVAERIPGPAQQGILSPGLAEHGDAARLQDSAKLWGRLPQIHVVQDGIAPNTVETTILERETMPIRLDEP